MEKEYIIAFSSFYKAAYAQEVLAGAGINATLRRLPAELVRSCGTGLYLRTADIEKTKDALTRKDIASRGIYEIKGGRKEKKTYSRI